MAVWFEIDTKSGVPIYVQVVSEVRRALEVGGLEAGDRLPTVRALAAELTVAPNTIVKAYGELQRMGLVESRAGVGTVIAEGTEAVSRERKVAAIEGRLRELVRDAVSVGYSQDDFWEKVDEEFDNALGEAANAGTGARQ